MVYVKYIIRIRLIQVFYSYERFSEFDILEAPDSRLIWYHRQVSQVHIEKENSFVLFSWTATRYIYIYMYISYFQAQVQVVEKGLSRGHVLSLGTDHSVMESWHGPYYTVSLHLSISAVRPLYHVA